MKAVAMGVCSVVLLALTSCASTASRDQMAPQAKAMTAEEVYIAYVERNAARRGIDLIWVHKPKFKEALAQD